MRAAFLGLGVVAAFSLGVTAFEGSAAACGGCFHVPGENDSPVTSHQMVFSISSTQTTLYDQISYTGNPASFAWVLPINGQATVGLSSQAVFTALDNNSKTVVTQPTPDCPPPPPNCGVDFAGGATTAPQAAADAGAVSVLSTQVVGPYQTVQLHSTDPNALTDWLTSNSYDIPADIQPIIAAYVNAGFDFLALKLLPNVGVNAMRPVRVTTQGATPTLPLRMVSAGTGATVGITLWVVAEGRYEPQNFPWFRVQDSEIVWDFTTSSSNYETLRTQKEAAANNATWEVESSLDLSVNQIQNAVQNQVTIDSFSSAGPDYPVDTSDGGASDGGSSETSDQLLEDDLNALFSGIPTDSFRLTRLRTDLAHAALANDLTLQASSDQSVLSNLRTPGSTTGTYTCPNYSYCSANQGGGFGGVGDQGGTTTTSNGGSSFSCAATPSDASGPVLLVSLGGLVGLTLVRSRVKRGKNEKK